MYRETDPATAPDPDESRTVPADGLLVRPYVAPSGRPRRPQPPTGPTWPQSGPAVAPASVREPAPGPARTPAPPAVPTGRERGSRLPMVAFALLALAAAGILLFLLRTPEPEPQRTSAPPGLSVPVLPARSPGVDAEPPPDPSVRSSAPPAPDSASAGASASPSAGRDGRPTPTPSASSQRPSASGSGTLRPGDRGPEVRDLQQRLYGQGFTYVSLTGVYDEQTRRGVTQLQQDRGIKGDPPGVYGPATRAAFGSGG
ncbi:peptidoglycan-binding protein [Streptomyces sp. NPDC060031]|uniref:peptidoglycan-binding protein n=1 Tax=Streptomyces sp. NPDC060031 TaxID=3347043 RepID=UPI0036940F67